MKVQLNILLPVIFIVTNCSSAQLSKTANVTSGALVTCEPSGSGYQLTRSEDKKTLGRAVSKTACEEALAGMNSGVICTHTLYSRRPGWAPTVIGSRTVSARATGHTGTSDVATCNKSIKYANKMIVCSYSGSGLGWKTTRTYWIPPEDARYPHRFGSSNPSLDDCLKVAAGSIVVWQGDQFTHQTCRWGGSAWFPTCALDPKLSLNGRSGNAATCISTIQSLNSQCKKTANDEVKNLRRLIGSSH